MFPLALICQAFMVRKANILLVQALVLAACDFAQIHRFLLKFRFLFEGGDQDGRMY